MAPMYGLARPAPVPQSPAHGQPSYGIVKTGYPKAMGISVKHKIFPDFAPSQSYHPQHHPVPSHYTNEAHISQKPEPTQEATSAGLSPFPTWRTSLLEGQGEGWASAQDGGGGKGDAEAWYLPAAPSTTAEPHLSPQKTAAFSLLLNGCPGAGASPRAPPARSGRGPRQVQPQAASPERPLRVRTSHPRRGPAHPQRDHRPPDRAQDRTWGRKVTVKERHVGSHSPPTATQPSLHR